MVVVVYIYTPTHYILINCVNNITMILCIIFFTGTITSTVVPSGLSVIQYKEDVTLKCDVYSDYELDDLTYEWTLNNNSILNFQYSSFPTNSSLFIQYADSSSVTKGGLYQCIATHTGDQVVGKSNVVLVAFVPILTETPSNTTVTAGSEVTLNCSASGYPTPEIEWYRLTESKGITQVDDLYQYTSVLPDSVTIVTADESETIIVSTMTITTVDHQDYGYYLCVANTSNTSISSLYGEIQTNTSFHDISETITIHGKFTLIHS